MSKKSIVLINGKRVGSASDLVIDMPWFSARFEPNSSFAEFARLFEDLDRAYEENRYDAVDQLNDEINKLKISIEDGKKQLLFSSDPMEKPLQRISTVRIRAREIVWRPVHNF